MNVRDDASTLRLKIDELIEMTERARPDVEREQSAATQLITSLMHSDSAVQKITSVLQQDDPKATEFLKAVLVDVLRSRIAVVEAAKCLGVVVQSEVGKAAPLIDSRSLPTSTKQ